MVLYGITLVTLVEELRDADPTILSLFYANDTVFDGLVKRSASQLRLLIYRGIDRGYFLETAKLRFIADKTEEKEAVRRTFERVGLHLN